MRSIKAIVVDDSAFMRKSLTLMLESDPAIQVVDTARDGAEGIEKIRKHRPDIVTLDIEMPKMDGLSALKIIMKEVPIPVLMVSSLTTEGAQATLDALALGAVDFIPKQLSYVSLDITKIRDELIHKVKSIVQSRSLAMRLQRIRNVHARISGPAAPAAPAFSGKLPGYRGDLNAVVIGVSTGGPNALLQILPKIPGSYPLGIAIVQHMPPRFTKSMAERLNGICDLSVKEAEDGDELTRGSILIAPGGKHLTFARERNRIVAVIREEPSNVLYRPSVDIMVSSAVGTYDSPLLGVILTGMGKDGLLGMHDLKRKGGFIIAQNEETSIVYGMPKAVVDDGIADVVVPLDSVVSSITNLTMKGEYERAIS
jgi:two-component system, chemotaxis family, protein-glutamate methylesterase/glutaminase